MNIRYTMKKREAILDTSLKLITELGFHATPMSLISKESKVGTGTIYHYFESKEELIDTLYTRVKERMGEAMDNSKGPHIKDQFWGLWLSLFSHFINNPEEFQFIEQYANSPLIRKEIREVNKKYYQPALDLLDKGVEMGVLRNMDIDLMLALVYGNLAATVKLYLDDQFDLSEGMIQQAIQSAWDGVKTT